MLVVFDGHSLNRTQQPIVWELLIRLVGETMKLEEIDAQIREDAIERRSLHDEVVDRMRDMIIEGRLRAGTRINESELCRRLGVSRTPVREAIKTIAGEGLIELVRSKGAIVKRLSTTEVDDMLEVVKLIESFAASVGIERASDAEIGDIVAMHKRMREHYKARERLAYYKLNQSIHTALVGLTHNATLMGTHEALQMRLRRIRYMGHEGRSYWSGAMREHEAMIKALKKRDADELRDAVRIHLDKTRERVLPLAEGANN